MPAQQESPQCLECPTVRGYSSQCVGRQRLDSHESAVARGEIFVHHETSIVGDREVAFEVHVGSVVAPVDDARQDVLAQRGPFGRAR